MDLNWEAIGAIGEILGAIAVVLTLAYLARQLRQNSQTLRASALDASITAANDVRKSIYESAEVAEIIRRGSADPASLTEDEKIRFRLVMHNIVWGTWNIYVQAQLTGLSAGTWEAQIPLLTRILSSPGGKWYWANSRQEVDEEYREYIDSLLAQDDA